MTHEAFPRVMDYFADGDGFYLVMELIRGKDLSDLLQERSEPFETRQVLEWADQILDALEDLHSQDIVHRDIKPSNLKLTPRGRIKLLDFGIAKGAAGDMPTLQSTNSIAAATLQYAPLEQVLRASSDWNMALSVNYAEKTQEVLEHGTDARSDLYALGATLYHLLTNNLPVNAPTRALAVWSGKDDPLYYPEEFNFHNGPSITNFFDKAMEIDSAKRFSSAFAMRNALKEIEANLKNGAAISRYQDNIQDSKFDKPKHLKHEHGKNIKIAGTTLPKIEETETETKLSKKQNRHENIIKKPGQIKFQPDPITPEFKRKQSKRALIAAVTILGLVIAMILVTRVLENNAGVNPFFKRAEECYYKADYNCALVNYSQGIELDPDFAVAYQNRALVYEKLGEKAKAEADRKKYEELTKKP